MAEVTQEQLKQRGEAFARAELAKLPEDSVLARIKADALGTLEESLKKQNGGETNVSEKLAKAGKDFDEQIIRQLSEGTATKGNVTAFKKADPQAVQSREAAGGLVKTLLGFIGSFFGSIGSVIMSVLAMIPGVGGFFSGLADNMSDMASGRSPEQRTLDERTAGAVEALNVRLGSRQVSINEDDRKMIFADLRNYLEKPPVSSTPIAANAAAQATATVRPSGVSQDNFDAPNGTLPGAAPQTLPNKSQQASATPPAL